jgi:hypothetical protein
MASHPEDGTHSCGNLRYHKVISTNRIFGVPTYPPEASKSPTFLLEYAGNRASAMLNFVISL